MVHYSRRSSDMTILVDECKFVIVHRARCLQIIKMESGYRGDGHMERDELCQVLTLPHGIRLPGRWPHGEGWALPGFDTAPWNQVTGEMATWRGMSSARFWHCPMESGYRGDGHMERDELCQVLTLPQIHQNDLFITTSKIQPLLSDRWIHTRQ